MTSRKTLSIEECLFGPERKCPSNVWDAVLGGITKSGSSAADAAPTTSNSSSLINTAGENNQKQEAAALYLGIDDLDDGRWARPENQKHVLPLQELRRISSQGITDHRGVAWRILLGLLPVETSEWKNQLLERRLEYRQLVSDLFVEPQHDGNDLRGHHGKKKQQAQAKREYEINKKKAPSTKAKEQLQQPDGGINNNNDDSVDNNQTQAQLTNGYAGNHHNHDDENGGIDDAPSTPRSGGRRRESMIDQTSIDPSIKVSVPRERNLMMKDVDQLAISMTTTSEEETTQQEEQPTGFEFTETGQRPPMTRTASAWLRRNSLEEDNNNNNTALDDDPATDELGVLKDVLDENYENDFKTKDSEEETKSMESLADMVPMHIQEEWRKTGRDITTLDNMQNGTDSGMNTLLVSHHAPPPAHHLVYDDPLSTDTDSKWFQFFENASLLDEIRKDVVRTHPELYFFLEPENNLGQRRYAALERILFVWAKLNRGVRYVQGMNEIVGTIYYVLANDDSEVWACEAEADTYFLFNTLMVEMRDVFVAELDEADTGIQGRLSNMTALLSLHDPEVRCHLVDIGIDPAFYGIRWLTTLLSREFLLPDTIRLWDSMFASTHKDNFIRYVCVTMVMIIRDKLLKGDFSTCLRLLQAYPSTNIDTLLESSRALWIYESQVTLACHKGGISLHQALCTITPPPSIVMAYGLPGGVARARVVEAAVPAQKGFFSRAFGQMRAGAATARSRTQSYDR